MVGVGELLALGMHDGASPWRLAPAFFVTGLATGVLNAVLGRESVASVPPDRAAMGSGANNTARYLGAAIGITLFSVLMTHTGDGLPQGWNVADGGRGRADLRRIGRHLGGQSASAHALIAAPCSSSSGGGRCSGTPPEYGLSSNRIGEPASVSGPYAGWSTSTSSPCDRVCSQE